MNKVKCLLALSVMCFLLSCGNNDDKDKIDTNPQMDTTTMQADSGNTNGYAPPHTDSSADNKDSIQ